MNWHKIDFAIIKRDSDFANYWRDFVVINLIKLIYQNYFLILRIAVESRESLREAVLSFITFLVTPRIISGSRFLKASRALVSSPTLIAPSTFLMKDLIRLMRAVLTIFFFSLERNAFLADFVFAICNFFQNKLLFSIKNYFRRVILIVLN